MPVQIIHVFELDDDRRKKKRRNIRSISEVCIHASTQQKLIYLQHPSHSQTSNIVLLKNTLF